MRVDIPRSDLYKFLANCSVKDQAGVQKEIQRQADRAATVENVLGLAILVLTGDEGGKVEREAIPALLKRAEKVASLVGYWDKLLSWWTGKSNARTFDVCEPLPGAIVVRPRQGALPFPPPAGLAGVERPVALSFDDLMKQTARAAQCFSPSAVRSFLQPPYITGRVVFIPLPGNTSATPAVSQWVSLTGPGYQRGCSTTQAGEFSFSALPPGTYTLYLGSLLSRTFNVDAHTDLNLGDLPLPVRH